MNPLKMNTKETRRKIMYDCLPKNRSFTIRLEYCHD